MREKFSLPERYYDDQHQQESDDALNEMERNPEPQQIESSLAEKTPEGLRDELGFSNLEIVGQIDPSQYPLARKTIRNLKELSDVLSREILEDIISFCEEKERPTEKILKYVHEHKLNLPSFKLVGGQEHIDIALNKCGYEDIVVAPQNLLVVFNLPRQIARHWDKGTGSWGTQGKEGDYFIEWGRFYRDMMPRVWGFVDYMERDGEVGFGRLSGSGEHDPEQFYYLWEARDQVSYETEAA